MQADEKRVFLQRLSAVWDIYGKDLSPDIGEIYWRILEQFPLADVLEAMKKHLLDPKSGQFPPKPADLIRNMKGTDPEAEALRQWSQVLRAIALRGVYQSVRFKDPITTAVILDLGGWVEVNQMQLDAEPFWEKRFVQRYLDYHRRGDAPEAVPLIGLSDLQNGAQQQLPPASSALERIPGA